VVGYDLEQPDGAEANRLTGIEMARHPRELPFERSLFIASLHQVPKLWIRCGRAAVSPSHRFAALLFWELPAIPKPWRPALRMFDVLLTCSDFVRRAAETAIPEVPTFHAEHPLEAPVHDFDRASVRRKHGIAVDSVVFLCTFDPRSGLLRKNPAATIRAFLEAFPGRSDVALVVKSNGPAADEDLARGGVPVEVRHDPRVVWLDDYLPHDDLMRLFASCDVYVSLHRSEGLGLVPMEAMLLGKLVIATGYSGNMTYMNEGNSIPVPFRLVEPTDARHFMTRRFAGPGALWADPDVVAAQAMMRRVVDEPGTARQLAASARADITARQEDAWRADWVERLDDAFAASTRHRQRPGLRQQLLANELLNPSLLRKNAHSAWQWILRQGST
jgi:glycosyltransferase involved in cell wall biosynthesis